MSEGGHRYSFGAPSKGWPTFGPDGKIIRASTYPTITPTPERPPPHGAFEEAVDAECRRIADEIIRELFTPCIWCGGEHPSFECEIGPGDLGKNLRGIGCGYPEDQPLPPRP